MSIPDLPAATSLSELDLVAIAQEAAGVWTERKIPVKQLAPAVVAAIAAYIYDQTEGIKSRTYGAVPDCQWHQAVCVASVDAPKRLVVTGGRFAQADVGKSFTGFGLGAAAGGYYSTITAVISATTIDLADNISTFTSASRLLTWGTDNTAAFAAMSAAYLALPLMPTNEDGAASAIVLAPGGYFTTGGINLTRASAAVQGGRGAKIVGWGAVIHGATNGGNVIDAAGSWGLSVSGVTVRGDQSRPPQAGIFMGRAFDAGAMGRCDLTRVKAYGYFSKACIYNLAAETSHFLNCDVTNLASNAYALIQDGCYQQGGTSGFVSITVTPNTGQSFSVNHATASKFTAAASGSKAVYISGGAVHSYQSCYFNSQTTAVVLDETYQRIGTFAFRGTFEGPAVQYFEIVAPGNTALQTLDVVSDSVQPTSCYFNIDARIGVFKGNGWRIHFNNLGSGIALFNDPTRVELTGDIIFTGTAPTGVTLPALFSGMLQIGNLQTRYNASAPLAQSISTYGAGLRLVDGDLQTNLPVNGVAGLVSISMTRTGSQEFPSGATSADFPTVTISEPDIPIISGGVQATAAITEMRVAVRGAIASGGSGYTVGNVLTLPGTYSSARTVLVSAVGTGGTVTAITTQGAGSYSVWGAEPLVFTGGSGAGFSMSGLAWAPEKIVVTNGGAGYVDAVVTISSLAKGTATLAFTSGTFSAQKGYVGADANGTQLGLGGTTGKPVQHLAPMADGTRISQAISGGTYTVPVNAGWVALTNAGTVATQTLALPTTDTDGHRLLITATGQVTALTFSPSVTGWTNGSMLAALASLSLIWNSALSAWRRL